MGKLMYLAGRLDRTEGTIAAFALILESRGHVVLEKWWEMGRLPKPYLDHPGTSGPAAYDMIEAATSCDVLILFQDDTMLGAAIEFGAALGSCNANPGKQIYVIRGSATRQSVFYAHHRVTYLQTIADLRNQPWY